jgi:predicted short-subunit dehydrogenase-like oxidoreductase (DUF2520 family)
MKLRINIIGAGKVGQALGYLFSHAGCATVIGIHNTTMASAQLAIKFIGEGEYYSDIKSLPSANVYLITTPDDLILETCLELCSNAQLRAGSIFLHCSGALTSDVLCAAKLKNCHIASIHPAFAFSEQAVQDFKGTFCAMEGDEAALCVLGPLFGEIGGVVCKINKKNKMLYHIGCVFAANYLVTLASQASSLFMEAGMDDEMSYHILLGLMRQALANLAQLKTPSLALTGPLARGDVSTIQSHIQALSGHKQKDLYALLGEKTLQITEHDSGLKDMLMDLFLAEKTHG